jgi:hypothetical protein
VSLDKGSPHTGSAMPLADSVLRLFGEARLDKVLIERKSPLDAQLLHGKKGDAIREGVVLVLMALEIRPPFVK